MIDVKGNDELISKKEVLDLIKKLRLDNVSSNGINLYDSIHNIAGTTELTILNDFSGELSKKENVQRYDINETFERSNSYDLSCHYLRIYVDGILDEKILGESQGE